MSSAQAAGGLWLPAGLNAGHAYRDRVGEPAASIADFYAGRYPHSDQNLWIQRLAAGEIWCNGVQLRADAPLQAGVLTEHAIVFDDGDLLVLNKPSGLPVLPAGGFLEHTLLAQLQGWVASGQICALAGHPRPVHRLGRFTSGLLVCARRSETRAWLSAQLRDSTSGAVDVGSGRSCRKLYRALCQPLPSEWLVGETRAVTASIGRRAHPLLGEIWCVAEPADPAALASRSDITLLERCGEACWVEVAIATGRPHQIRIHTAFIGAPLLGDPLYRVGGLAESGSLPGAGGYRLHAYRLQLHPPVGTVLQFEAALPPALTR